MTKQTFNKIIGACRKEVRGLAQKNGAESFCRTHQKEIIDSAKDLLKFYPKAQKEIVFIACWLHDIAYYCAGRGESIKKVRRNHHVRGAEIAAGFLEPFSLDYREKELIKKCILNHRNMGPYKPKSLEEKAVAVADTLSHFKGAYYSNFIGSSGDINRELKQDWRDFCLLPKSKKLVLKKYCSIKQSARKMRA